MQPYWIYMLNNDLNNYDEKYDKDYNYNDDLKNNDNHYLSNLFDFIEYIIELKKLIFLT